MTPYKENAFVYNILVLRGQSSTLTDIQNIYHNQYDKNDGYLFNLHTQSDEPKLDTKEQYDQYTHELLGYIQLATNPDNEYAENLVQVAKQSLVNIFTDINQRITERNLKPNPVIQNPSELFTDPNKAHEYIRSLRDYDTRVTYIDTSIIDVFTDYPDLAVSYMNNGYIFNTVSSFKRIPEQFIYEHNLLDDQSVYRFDDETLIVALPTLHGPILDVAEAIVETYSQIDAELYFGNGDFRGFFEIHDGVTYFGRKEPSKEAITSLLSTIGQEDHLIDFGWFLDEHIEELAEELY